MRKWFSEIVRMFSARWVYEHLNYILFLALLAFVYIANAHYVEKKLRTIDRLEREVDDVYWEYMSAKSTLMKTSTKSNLEKALEQDKITINGDMPKKLKKRKL